MKSPENSWQRVVSTGSTDRSKSVQHTRSNQSATRSHSSGASGNGRRGRSHRDAASKQLRSPGAPPQAQAPPQRPPIRFSDHVGLDFDLYRQAFDQYRTEAEYLQAVRLRMEARENKSWAGDMWRGACGMARSVKTRISRGSSRNSAKVVPVNESESS